MDPDPVPIQDWDVQSLEKFTVEKNPFLYYIFFSTLFNTASSAAPQSPPVSEDNGIEPRTVGTLALDVRRFNHLARSHPY